MHATPLNRPTRRELASSLGLLAILLTPLAIAEDPLSITQAEWKTGDAKLEIQGRNADRRAYVTLTDTATERAIGVVRASRRGTWEASLEGLDPAPCSIAATSNGESAARDVTNAPATCSTANNGGGSGGGGYAIAEHQGMTYSGPSTCLECHTDEAHDVFSSTHYQWKGDTPYMLNMPGVLQGKHAGAINAYCGNITGNWAGCSGCHIGLGAKPTDTASDDQLANIDCLVCHQEGYKRKKVGDVFVPDTDNMTMSMDEAVQTVHRPTRAACLQCHAKAGGGDAVKRGDLALATANTTDRHYDVHMATTGADLACQDCHVPSNHRFPGKGSDIRPTDLDQPLECASSACHSASPHDSGDLNRHTTRVACQTCHIPIYAKDAADTVATEATETHRSWTAGSDHTTPPYHPVTTKANNLIPVYRHWNGYSDNVLLGDSMVMNPERTTYETSVPQGSVNDGASKLYPFKYKTSDYPLHTNSSSLIALDTSVFFATADAEEAAKAGMSNMGLDRKDGYQWVITDTYQLLNHQVSDHDQALRCSACHMTTARMDLQGELGYAPANANTSTCASGCHSSEKAREWRFGDFEEFEAHHEKHAEKRAACSKCHAFER